MNAIYEKLLRQLTERENKAQLDYYYYKGAREGVQLLFKEMQNEDNKSGRNEKEKGS